MKTFVLSVLTFSCTLWVNAQQFFKDSDQQLGNFNSWEVKLGDLDDDGDLDAVVANWNFNNEIQNNKIWINNGTGNFTESTQELGSCQRIALFDIDFDGDIDIIENAEKIYINNGYAVFEGSNNFHFSSFPVFTNKLSGTNQYEAVTINISGSSTILRIYTLTTDSAKFKDSLVVEGFAGSNLAIGDLNNDEYSDIILNSNTSNNLGKTILLFNDKNGGFVRSSQELSEYFSINIYLADFNSDGFIDILQCAYHHPSTSEVFPTKLYINNGNETFTEQALPYNTSYITASAVIFDFDNDDDLDIMMNHGHAFNYFSRNSELLINDGHANFTLSTSILDRVKSTSIASADLDNDNDLDLFLACNDGDANSVNQNRVWFNVYNDSITNILETYKYKVNIYPNPTQNTLQIEYPDTSQIEALYKIIDSTGKTVQEGKLTGNTICVDKLKSGRYILKFIIETEIISKKITIDR